MMIWSIWRNMNLLFMNLSPNLYLIIQKYTVRRENLNTLMYINTCVISLPMGLVREKSGRNIFPDFFGKGFFCVFIFSKW